MNQEPILKCKKLGQSEKKNPTQRVNLSQFENKSTHMTHMFIKRPLWCNYSNIMTLRFTHFMYNKKLHHKLLATYLIRETKPIFTRFQ